MAKVNNIIYTLCILATTSFLWPSKVPESSSNIATTTVSTPSSLLVRRFQSHAERLAEYYSFTIKPNASPSMCLRTALQSPIEPGGVAVARLGLVFCIDEEAHGVDLHQSAPDSATVLSDIVIKDELILEHDWHALTSVQMLKKYAVKTSSYFGLVRFGSNFDFSSTSANDFEKKKRNKKNKRKKRRKNDNMLSDAL